MRQTKPVQVSPGVFSVPLTQGKTAYIDAIDVKHVSRFTWSAIRMGDSWYARGWVYGKVIQLHRFLIKSDKRVYHADGDGLNNRRENLKTLSRAPVRISSQEHGIPLTQGKTAVIDSEDLRLVKKFNWCAQKIGKQWYTVTTVRGKRFLMHQLLIKRSPGQRIDHRDGNGLNNRKKNLRVCNASQNAANMSKHADSSSPFKGVTYSKSQHSWVAQLMVNRVRVLHSYHKTAESAAEAYDESAYRHFGEFARLNFPLK